jgi:hypothetical protein
MRYLFLGYADQDVERGWTSDELNAVIEQHSAFGARMREAGKFVAGVGLDASAAAAVVRHRGDGDFLVTDGPFTETSEQIGGLYILECDDYDEALALAKQIPFSPEMAIEVRPAPY